MQEILKERIDRLREYFKLSAQSELTSGDAAEIELTATAREHLSRFNIEWHVIPSNTAVAMDDDYIKRLYPMCARNFAKHGAYSRSCREALVRGHNRHQGRILGVEATQKPNYLPGNRQFYGTPYGFDPTADPFAQYLGRAGLLTGTRFAHSYASLRAMINAINDEWRERSLLPRGYRLTICPPAVFNLVGTVFHQEWSEAQSLELGFYRDDHGNAKCYAVGSNAPGDFSYIHQIETDSDWTLLGFRTALVPE
ncbi:MAG: hypothetical protein WBV94_12350 [Blastocatellia bacterium]